MVGLWQRAASWDWAKCPQTQMGSQNLLITCYHLSCWTLSQCKSERLKLSIQNTISTLALASPCPTCWPRTSNPEVYQAHIMETVDLALPSLPSPFQTIMPWLWRIQIQMVCADSPQQHWNLMQSTPEHCERFDQKVCGTLPEAYV